MNLQYRVLDIFSAQPLKPTPMLTAFVVNPETQSVKLPP